MHICQGLQQKLNSHFGLTVRTTWSQLISLFAIIFIAIDSSSGGEYKILAPMFLHHLEQIQRTQNIILIIHDRFFHGLPNSFFGSKMHDTINGLPNLNLLLEQLVKFCQVHNREVFYLDASANLLFCFAFLFEYLFNSIIDIIKAIRHIIDNNHIS